MNKRLIITISVIIAILLILNGDFIFAEDGEILI